MNKNYRTELRRVFLFEELPEPLNRADDHLQFFDNYIENTRMRLRSIRAPHTKDWTYILEQRFSVEENDLSRWNVAEIFLSEAEHAAFEHFEGREIKKNERVESNELRFNRYFFEFAGKTLELDLFLNPLWGLNIAKAVFETEEEMKDFQMPTFAVLEVTQDKFFTGAELLGKTIEDVREQLKVKN